METREITVYAFDELTDMGTTNIDKSNGIRYGVIPANDVGQVWFEDAESDYGEPTCPKCGNEVKAPVLAEGDTHVEFESYWQFECADFECHRCKHTLDNEDVYGDSPVAFTYSGEGYEMQQGGDDCDIFVLKSPYYTLAPFCSPCAPGAGYLPSANEDGVKTYCLGHEWFESGKAPYVVFDASGKIVLPARHEIAKTVDGAFMVLVDGVQWGGTRDMSGSGDNTWESEYEAAAALASDI